MRTCSDTFVQNTDTRTHQYTTSHTHTNRYPRLRPHPPRQMRQPRIIFVFWKCSRTCLRACFLVSVRFLSVRFGASAVGCKIIFLARLTSLLHGRRGWTAEYRHAHADVAKIGAPRFQVLKGLSTHMERSYQSETVPDGACPLQAIYKRFRSDKALNIHGGCPWTRRCTSCFFLSREMNIVILLGGGCGVNSASTGYSMDSTCSAPLVRCVAWAPSSPMFQLASLTSMT